jgi:hypothetical protein
MMMQYIFLRVPGGAYYFRKRVPFDLVDKVSKKVIMVSLKTKNSIKALNGSGRN